MTTLQPLQNALGPRVYNCRHGHAPADAVNIMRPGKWGNPFVIGPDGSRAEVVAKHRAWLPTQPHLTASLHELRGRNLLCCCAPDLCHGHTLLEMANGLSPRVPVQPPATWVASIDYETWATADIKKVGSRAYAAHPDTRVLMMAWHVNGDASAVELWLPGMPFPEKLAWIVRNGGFLCGWNSDEFERFVWRYKSVPMHGWPEVQDSQWLDVMHLAAAANVPRSLDGASMAVGGPKKDGDGHKLMLELTNGARTPREMLFDGERLSIHPKLTAKWQRFCSYCRDDVRAEEGTAIRLPPWPNVSPWHRIPAVNRAINDRGVLMDVELVDGLNRAALAETARLDREMNRLTNGRVLKTSNVASLKPWLMDLGVKLPLIADKEAEEAADPEAAPADAEDEVDPDENKPDAKYRLRKSDIVDLLVDPNLPEPARLALTWRMEAAKASAKKLAKMLACASPDGRLRGWAALGGAQQTMRWSAKDWQGHNFPRNALGCPDEIEDVYKLKAKESPDEFERLSNLMLGNAIEAGRSGDIELIRQLFTRTYKDSFGRTIREEVLPFVSRMLRRTLGAALGKLLQNGDYSQIEARIPVWLAGQQNMVEAFREGKDIYRVQASPVFGIAPELLSKLQRLIGKVMILSLGFAGSHRALVPFGLNYGVTIPVNDAKKYVTGFRESNQHLVAYWNNLLNAAVAAVNSPGRTFEVAPTNLIAFFMVPGTDCLCCRLPSGRLLRYWAPRMYQGYWDKERKEPKPFLDLTVLQMKGRFGLRRTLWRGLIMENVTQAIAADLLANALVNCEDAGLPVVLHVHDNAVVELPEQQAIDRLGEFKQCMLATPNWTRGLPVAAEVSVGARFE